MFTDSDRNSIKIVLASASPRRRELLQRMGITPEVVKSGAEEDLKETDPQLLVEALSALKCLDVADKRTDPCIVIGADTVVSADGRILGKPSDEEDAADMLRLISGRAHHVYTGVTLCRMENGKRTAEKTFSVCTEVFVDDLTEDEIRDYIATGEPMDKAGAYGIQGAFLKHVNMIRGDYFNVVGLPVNAVYRALKEMA